MNAAGMVVLCTWSLLSGSGLPPDCGAPTPVNLVPQGALRKPNATTLTDQAHPVMYRLIDFKGKLATVPRTIPAKPTEDDWINDLVVICWDAVKTTLPAGMTAVPPVRPVEFPPGTHVQTTTAPSTAPQARCTSPKEQKEAAAMIAAEAQRGNYKNPIVYALEPAQ